MNGFRSKKLSNLAAMFGSTGTVGDVLAHSLERAKGESQDAKRHAGDVLVHKTAEEVAESADGFDLHGIAQDAKAKGDNGLDISSGDVLKLVTTLIHLENHGVAAMLRGDAAEEQASHDKAALILRQLAKDGPIAFRVADELQLQGHKYAAETVRAVRAVASTL